MPVYEYYCTNCHTAFEAMRSMAAAGEPYPCVSCGQSQRVSRTISLFARVGGSELDRNESAPVGGGGCCGGACGCR